MGAAEPPLQSGDSSQRSDEELIRRFCASPPDVAAGELLGERLIGRIEKIARRKVFAGICPRSMNPANFADEVAGVARIKVIEGVSSYRFEGLSSWLDEIIENVALDLKRKEEGRSPKGRRETVSIEDAPQESFRSDSWIDPVKLVQERELSEVFEAALRLHEQESEHGRKSADAIRLRLKDYAPRQIAMLRNISLDNVYKLISRDYVSLRTILTVVFRLSARHFA
jgi:DNA-directed RNA polymerase specialized sigma24 family protein